MTWSPFQSTPSQSNRKVSYSSISLAYSTRSLSQVAIYYRVEFRKSEYSSPENRSIRSMRWNGRTVQEPRRELARKNVEAFPKPWSHGGTLLHSSNLSDYWCLRPFVLPYEYIPMLSFEVNQRTPSDQNREWKRLHENLEDF